MAQTQAEKFFWRKDPTQEANKDTSKTKEAPFVEQAEAKKPALKSGLLIGIPCHNAEASIARTVVNLASLGADIIVCDDGSSDLTEDIAKRLDCKVIQHPRELGRSDSVTSLFLAAKKLQAEVLLTLGPDSRTSISELTRLVEQVRSGEVDIAIGTTRSEDVIAAAHRDGGIADRASLTRAYGKKTLTMISPPGTGSVVVEKEVLEFADQQGLKVRQYSITEANDKIGIAESQTIARPHFESRFMTYAASKHPLVFLGIPSIAFLYVAALQAVLATSFANFTLNTLASFGLAIASSPLFLVSVALSIGAAILYSQKAFAGKLETIESQDARL
jgi:glycosyltransferase involved in cell wall biosynthesis